MHYKENILITGGAGYIGSHTAKLLFSKGYNVIVLDNLCRGHIELVKWGEFINGDLENINLTKNVLCEYQIKAVIHFAAFAFDIQIGNVAKTVVVMQTAMPCMAMVVVLAKKFGSDDIHATENLFLSTILSLATLPLIYFIIQIL